MSAFRRRIMLWLWLLVLFSGRADGVAALLSARMVSSGSDAPVRAGRSSLEPIGMALGDTRKWADEFLAKGNILAGGPRDSTPKRRSPHKKINQETSLLARRLADAR